MNERVSGEECRLSGARVPITSTNSTHYVSTNGDNVIIHKIQNSVKCGQLFFFFFFFADDALPISLAFILISEVRYGAIWLHDGTCA